MTDTNVHGSEPPYHLTLDRGEVRVAGTALKLLLSDEAHEPQIRRLAREALEGLEGVPGKSETVAVSLTPQQMRIMHTAVKLLFDDLQREQATERDLLRGILDKLPDEHTMRAIELN
ncbi:MAG: hypothetical protein WB507_02600 [Solirubrobacterales bacterium]